MIYLDNAATTKIDPAVLEAMMPYLTSEYGNPGALYSLATRAKAAVSEARKQVADFISADPHNIIFTSGGTEANNTVFKGLVEYLTKLGKTRIITSRSEHDSVIRAVNEIAKRGFDVTFLDSDEHGCVPPESVAAAIGDDVGLVSIMHMNNETGSENDVREIARICHTKQILFHTDCVQAASCISLDVNQIGCDFLSMSSHKIHGPKGVGALYARFPSLLQPLIIGGHEQEFGLRGGTENVPGIVGFGKACELMKNQMHDIEHHCSALKQVFYTHLQEALCRHGIENIMHINGPSIIKRGKTLNIRFDGVDAQTLVLMLSNNVSISAGSACTSHESTPSHVLLAMGVSPKDAMCSVRISFSKMNTEEEAHNAAEEIADNIEVMKLLW